MSCCFDCFFPRLQGMPEGRMGEALAQNSQSTICRPGESRDPVTLLVTQSADIPVFFRAHPMRAGDFLLRGQEKVTKEKATPVLRFSSIHGRKIRGGRPGLPTRHPWRGGKWARSIAPTLRAFSSGPHRSTRAPEKLCFDAVHPWPRAKRASTFRFAPPPAQEACPSGPLEHGGRMTDQSEGRRAGCAPVRRRHKDVPSANPGGRARILSTGMSSGRVRGVAFLWATFLWPRKERWHARLGGGRKNDMDVVRNASKGVRKECKEVAAPECAHIMRQVVAR